MSIFEREEVSALKRIWDLLVNDGPGFQRPGEEAGELGEDLHLAEGLSTGPFFVFLVFQVCMCLVLLFLEGERNVITVRTRPHYG